MSFVLTRPNVWGSMIMENKEHNKQEQENTSIDLLKKMSDAELDAFSSSFQKLAKDLCKIIDSQTSLPANKIDRSKLIRILEISAVLDYFKKCQDMFEAETKERISSKIIYKAAEHHRQAIVERNTEIQEQLTIGTKKVSDYIEQGQRKNPPFLSSIPGRTASCTTIVVGAIVLSAFYCPDPNDLPTRKKIVELVGATAVGISFGGDALFLLREAGKVLFRKVARKQPPHIKAFIELDSLFLNQERKQREQVPSPLAKNTKQKKPCAFFLP